MANRARVIQIRRVNGIPRLYVSGEAVPTIAYRNRKHEDYAYMKRFADSGHRVFFTTHLRDWGKPEAEYWKVVDEKVRAMLGFRDDLYVILGMYLGCGPEWAEAHPGHVAQDEKGPLWSPDRGWEAGRETAPYSLFSREFEREGVRQVKAHCEYARHHPQGDRIIGFFIEAGAAQEWIPFPHPRQADYAPVVTEEFRRWLRRKYGTDERLREGWKEGEVTLEGAIPPTYEELVASNRGDFFDPARGRREIDFQECTMQSIGDRIRAACRTAKKQGEGRLVGIFHEPPMEVGARDHEWQRVMEDPNIDFYAGPTCYESRKAGMPTPVHHLVDSLRLYNKLFFTEEDTRPHTFRTRAGRSLHARTREESRQTISRTILNTFCKGVLGWYWDFQHQWFTEPWFFEMFEDLQRIGAAVQKARPAPAAEVAVFVDEASITHTRGDNPLLNNMGHRLLIHEINRIGCPHDIYLLDHISRRDLPEYKLYIFLNAVRADEKQRRAVKRLRREGHVLFFPHASGFLNEESAGVENMADLVGMDFAEVDARRRAVVMTTDADHPLVNALPVGYTFGQFPRLLRTSLTGGTEEDPLVPPMHSISPVFCVDDAEARTLGYYVMEDLPESRARSRREPKPARRDDGYPVGFAVKEGEDWASVYAGVTAMTSELLRGLAKYAGAHVYLDTDDTLYANSRMVVLHTNWRGGKTRTIRLPKRTGVYDLLSGGREVARRAREFTVEVKPKTTYAFFLGDRPPEL